MERPLLIVNPRAGTRRGDRGRQALVAAVEAALGAVDVALTGWRGHGIELARRAVAEERRLVVAVGGDGTLNEVVNGVLEACPPGTASSSSSLAGPQVGLIASGTGSDFGHSVDLPATLAGQVAALASGRTRAIDVMRAEVDGPGGERIVRYSVNILSAGPGGLVVRYVHRIPGFVGGRAGYYLASLAALARTPRAEVSLRVESFEDAGGQGGPGASVARADGRPGPTVVERTLSTYVLAVCNGRVFGGGYRVAPMAAVDDGRLEVVSGGTESRLGLVRLMPRLYSGSHLGQRGVEHFSCRRLEVALADPGQRDRFLMEIDGEELGRLPLRVEVLPRALTLRV